jgi:hypothetical protein
LLGTVSTVPIGRNHRPPVRPTDLNVRNAAASTVRGAPGREVIALKRVSNTRAPKNTVSAPSKDIGHVIFIPTANPANDVAPSEALVSLARALGALAAELHWEGILTDTEGAPPLEKS